MAVTTAAVIGIGTGLASAGQSFTQAAQQKRAAEQARKEQERLMADARKKAEKDFYAGLNVPLDAFGEQYRQNIAGQQQTLQALQEGDTRNLVAGVGGVTAAAAQAAEGTRIGMADALYENRKMKADAQENLKQQLIQMDVGQAADESQRERDLLEARNASIQSGIQGIGMVGQGLNTLAPLYGKQGGLRRAEKIADADKFDMSKVTASAGGELSRAQILNTLKKQGFTGKDTRLMVNKGQFGDDFYKIFKGLYVPPTQTK